jgi:hypothetical protein
MTLSDLQAAVYDELGYASSPASAISTRVTRWINEGHRHLLRLPGCTGLRQGTLTFASVADQAIYGLPQAFDRIDTITQATNDVRLRNRTRDWFRSLDPGERSDGTPYVWIDWGLVSVLQQPASTGVWVASDSASDTGQTAKLIGVRANGDAQVQASAALNGTTRVAFGSISDYIAIVRWELSAVAVGTVTLYDAATSGNVLARLPIGRTSVAYQSVRLWPTPAQAVTYTVDGQLGIPDLANATDVPMLPESFHDLLATYARWKEARLRGDGDRAGMEEAAWREGSARLQAVVEYPADYRPVAGSRADSGLGWSNLGSYFPPDGWGQG